VKGPATAAAAAAAVEAAAAAVEAAATAAFVLTFSLQLYNRRFVQTLYELDE
jgi:hypothetical protein